MKRIGFGQVEPNHLSAQKTGQIYAQLPADSELGNVLENGRFVKYDYAAGKVNLNPTDGEWMLVLNEVKLYDDAWRYFGEGNGAYSAFAMKPDNRGEMYPRLFKTNVGDIFTTNCFKVTSETNNEKTMADLEIGDTVAPGTDGYLAAAAAESGDMLWKVVKVYTMPDGQEGVKLQRIK